VKPIEQLWECSDADEWDKALKRYWTFVKPQNLKLEQAFEALELQRVSQLDPRGWYDFLDDEYFRWKYTSPNRLATTRARLRWYIENGRLADLDRIRRDRAVRARGSACRANRMGRLRVRASCSQSRCISPSLLKTAISPSMIIGGPSLASPRRGVAN